MLDCSRYELESTCLYFFITPLVYGGLLLPLTTLQIFLQRKADKSHEYQVGSIPRIIHYTYTFLSIAFTVGWLLDTHMNHPVELLFGVIFVDLVTIGLAATLWVISIEQVSSIFLQLDPPIILPKWPRLLVYVLAFISIGWVLAINFLNFYLKRLWHRAYFYFWLAAIFCFGIVSLALLVVNLTYRVGSVKNVPNGRSLWTVVALVLLMGAFAIPSQIMDGMHVKQDTEKQFYYKLPDDTAFFSKVFIHLQGVGLLIGVWYAWIPRETSNTQYKYFN